MPVTNLNFPFGFLPTFRNAGGGNSLVLPQRVLAGVAPAIYRYDVVKAVATGVGVVDTLASDLYAGVALDYRAAGVAVENLAVVVEREALYEAQIVGGAPALTDLKSNASLKIDNARTHPFYSATNQSSMSIDGTTIATTSTLGVRMVNHPNRLENDPAAANARVVCKLNRHWEQTPMAGI